MSETYTITESQWEQVHAALLASIAICSMNAPDMQDTMIKASLVMDEIVMPDLGDDEDDD